MIIGEADITEIKEIISNKGTTLLYFYTETCGPCRMIRPILENINKELIDLKILKINAVNNRSLTEELNINSVPTLIFLNNGEESSRLSGFFPENKIKEWLNTNK